MARYRPLPPEPTEYQPGTREKVDVLEERAKMGYDLWHPGDAGIKGGSAQSAMDEDIEVHEKGKDNENIDSELVALEEEIDLFEDEVVRKLDQKKKDAVRDRGRKLVHDKRTTKRGTLKVDVRVGIGDVKVDINYDGVNCRP